MGESKSFTLFCSFFPVIGVIFPLVTGRKSQLISSHFHDQGRNDFTVKDLHPGLLGVFFGDFRDQEKVEGDLFVEFVKQI